MSTQQIILSVERRVRKDIKSPWQQMRWTLTQIGEHEIKIEGPCALKIDLVTIDRMLTKGTSKKFLDGDVEVDIRFTDFRKIPA